VDPLVEKLITMIKQSKDLDSIELYTRLVSHLAFCGAIISDMVLTNLLAQLQKNAFNTVREYQKIQKASLNCLSNLINFELT